MPCAFDDLKFVPLSGQSIRDEYFPEAVAAHAHGMPAAVPEIEIPNDTHPLGIGCKNDEGDALDTFQHHRMSAELVVGFVVRALSEQIEIVLGQAPERSDMGLLSSTIAPFHCALSRYGSPIDCHLPRKQASVVNTFKFVLALPIVNDDHPLRIGQKCTHNGMAILVVWSEIPKRIGVASRQ